MNHIKLNNQEWDYDPNSRLGNDGGFGEVFDGISSSGLKVAVKRIKMSALDSAKREIRIAEGFIHGSYKYIIPFLDVGMDQFSNQYFIVMEKADYSLQQYVDRLGQIDEDETIKILESIANGFSEANGIVHRDIKPGNVLFHEGKWKLADFGIARFVEESTSINTLNNFLTYPYAAPEQWEGKQVSTKTDIYALGCIAYFLLTGEPPFNGPNFKEQHLSENPRTIDNINQKLATLIAGMLRKNPENRVNLDRVVLILDELSSKNSPPIPLGLRGLEKAALVLEQTNLNNEAQIKKALREKKQRILIADEAFQTLDQIISTFFDQINKLSNSVIIKLNEGDKYLSFGSATLRIIYLNNGRVILPIAFPGSGWDVIAGATITVNQEMPKYAWGASLWYTNCGDQDNYRWWEVSYMSTRLSSLMPEYEPFSIADFGLADMAARPVMSIVQFARKPTPIDDENVEEFTSRWAELLNNAFRGKLARPHSFPLK